MDRKVLSITGADRRTFLNNLLTNDVAEGRLTYAALLTPQGKYLADFFLLDLPEVILVDVAENLSKTLIDRLSRYKLRSDVAIFDANQYVHGGFDPLPEDGYPDPRHPALGWRAYRSYRGGQMPDVAELRLVHLVPEYGAEMDETSYILEMGFERHNGVDFKKGCYVGQEVTARMKHKTELRKGLGRVRLSRPQPTGTTIMAGDQIAGKVTTIIGTRALAYLRYDRLQGPLSAGDASVTVEETLATPRTR